MIQVSLGREHVAEWPEKAFAKWGFARKEGNHLVAAMSEETFEQFLKENNLIVYKHHIKQYEDGKILGDFTVV
ncbi:hypothetical protein [Effusibacillus pohliae]|uniref:hypothetical protein n=1 Tax=Effusibacillus pohliae TaxID=232270 RepID=UPI0003645665|nr:hypothetical protein [Effusibacillus pohliae]